MTKLKVLNLGGLSSTDPFICYGCFKILVTLHCWTATSTNSTKGQLVTGLAKGPCVCFRVFCSSFFEWILHFKFFISGARAYDHLITFHNNPFQVLMILSSYMDVKKKTDML